MRHLLAIPAVMALALAALAHPAQAEGLCPADVRSGDATLANPWLLTNEVERYPAIRDADANGDGYACVFDPFLITLTTVVIDDVRMGAGGDFRLMSLADVRSLNNVNLLEEALRADRNLNDQVVVMFIEGEPNKPIVLDNIYGDP